MFCVLNLKFKKSKYTQQGSTFIIIQSTSGENKQNVLFAGDLKQVSLSYWKFDHARLFRIQSWKENCPCGFTVPAERDGVIANASAAVTGR